MPSTTMSGRLLPVIDLIPRIVRFVPPVGPELFCWILSPGTSPYSADCTVIGLAFVTRAESTPLMAYGVSRCERSMPSAVTALTSSSRAFASSEKSAVAEAPAVTVTVSLRSLKPISRARTWYVPAGTSETTYSPL